MIGKNICDLCHEVLKQRGPKGMANLGCRPDVESATMFVMGGHHTNRVDLSYLEQARPWTIFKFSVWREAYNLWLLRRIPRNVAAWSEHRETEGKDGSHLRQRIPQYVQRVKAQEAELDRIGWLGPIERIIKSERFRRQYAKDQDQVQR